MIIIWFFISFFIVFFFILAYYKLNYNDNAVINDHIGIIIISSILAAVTITVISQIVIYKTNTYYDSKIAYKIDESNDSKTKLIIDENGSLNFLKTDDVKSVSSINSYEYLNSKKFKIKYKNIKNPKLYIFYYLDWFIFENSKAVTSAEVLDNNNKVYNTTSYDIKNSKSENNSNLITDPIDLINKILNNYSKDNQINISYIDKDKKVINDFIFTNQLNIKYIESNKKSSYLKKDNIKKEYTIFLTKYDFNKLNRLNLNIDNFVEFNNKKK